MLNNEPIIAEIAFRDCRRVRPEEQKFYESYGEAGRILPAASYTLAAIRAAFSRVGREVRGGASANVAHAASFAPRAERA